VSRLESGQLIVFLLLSRLQLADVEESMVRKAAVFCIVKLYFVMGEDKVKPKFALLNASKVR
jgi:CLIP-associating protein 1/2